MTIRSAVIEHIGTGTFNLGEAGPELLEGTAIYYL